MNRYKLLIQDAATSKVLVELTMQERGESAPFESGSVGFQVSDKVWLPALVDDIDTATEAGQPHRFQLAATVTQIDSKDETRSALAKRLKGEKLARLAAKAAGK